MFVKLRKKLRRGKKWRSTNIGWIMWNRRGGIPAVALLDPYSEDVVIYVDPLIPEPGDLEVEE